MQLRHFAEQVLLSDALEQKLQRPSAPLDDDDPGAPRRIDQPGRPANLQFARPRAAPPMPRPGAFSDPLKRAVAHHIMANHELQACEVMALVLLAFPDAPAEFRSGLAAVLQDEQRHTRLHVERAAELGLAFGDLPVNCYIWKKALSFTSVLDYLAGLPLVFEGRNLDHTLEFERHFREAGDARGAAVMRAIHHDEIEHVRFGLEWLRRLKRPDQTDWEAFQSHLHWPLRPDKARGDVLDRESRRAAGMTEEFIRRLEAADRQTVD